MTRTTVYTWNPLTDSVTEESDGSGNVLCTYTNKPSRFGPLISENRSGATSYYHGDAIGSTRLTTNTSQSVVDSFLFDAWGNTVASSGPTMTPYQWCGRWGCQADLNTESEYSRARIYSPTWSRWCSIDAYALLAPQTFSVDLYAYASNSPISMIDPTGMSPDEPQETLRFVPPEQMEGNPTNPAMANEVNDVRSMQLEALQTLLLSSSGSVGNGQYPNGNILLQVVIGKTPKPSATLPYKFPTEQEMMLVRQYEREMQAELVAQRAIIASYNQTGQQVMMQQGQQMRIQLQKNSPAPNAQGANAYLDQQLMALQQYNMILQTHQARAQSLQLRLMAARLLLQMEQTMMNNRPGLVRINSAFPGWMWVPNTPPLNSPQ